MRPAKAGALPANRASRRARDFRNCLGAAIPHHEFQLALKDFEHAINASTAFCKSEPLRSSHFRSDLQFSDNLAKIEFEAAEDWIAAEDGGAINTFRRLAWSVNDGAIV